jgi:hypothetical protein
MIKNLETISVLRRGHLTIGQLRIKKGADVKIECEEQIANTEQHNYLIHTKGSVICYGPNGELVGTRTAGETTQSSLITWPAGISTLKANTDEYEYLCIYNLNNSPVIREEHRLTDGQELLITNDTKVLVLIAGTVRLNGVDFVGSEVIEIKSPSVRLVSVGNSFVSKVA